MSDASARWRRVEELCHAALARDASDRATFLAAACGDDAALRREVETLLTYAQAADGFLGAPVGAVAAQVMSDGAPEPWVGRRIGAYEIVSPLGAGGMGEVYRARDTQLGREVAIKVLPPAFTADRERLSRFEREARVLASLNHPHIGAIYGVESIALSTGSGHVARALILELVEGETLAERLARSEDSAPHGVGRGRSPDRPIPLAEVLTIARQIAEALEAAHEKGIVHRDLKPANIKITGDGTVKVLDFGLAKADVARGFSSPDAWNSPTFTVSGTHEGVLLGTAAYMSPEQARGQPVDKRADIWAFGCVLYEMLAGRMAFPGSTISDHIAAILEREPDWTALPATIPPGIRRLLRRCLDKDLKRRLHDIGDARIELNDLLTGVPGESFAAVISRPVAPWRALPWAVAVALSVTLVLVLWPPPRKTLPSPAPLRLSVELGADVRPAAGNRGELVSLSPDGAVVAFAGQPTASGGTQLYVRRLDQLLATPLSGTDGADGVFFSPDGQWIGFFAAGKLKKISVMGGAVVTLCDAAFNRGGAWGEDGTIVFMSTQASGFNLLRVSSAGGMPAAVTTLADGEVTHRWPQFLPGGRAVLYTSSTDLDAYDDANLVVQPLPTGARKIVLRGGYHGRYLSSGHLIYVHDGTLFAVPFDLDRLEATGRPVPALEDVLSNATNGGAQFALSATGTMVYLPGRSTGTSVPIHWMGRDGKTTPLRATPANWLDPQFAPDGHRLAMAILEGPHSDIWVYEWTRDTLTRLTSDPAQDRYPVWTPDGRRIAFASARADKSTQNLYWQRADGAGDVQRLTESKNRQLSGSWHPSGKFLAFEERNPQTNWDLMILPMEGGDASGWKPGTPTVFLNGPGLEQGPMFSPDGQWVAYVSDETGVLEVYVRPFPGPGGKWQVSSGGGSHPAWSRTKHELFYHNSGQIMVASYAMERDLFRAGKPRLWSDGRFQTRGDRPFDLHPDGERIAVAPAPQRQDGVRPDKAVFILNFFDELRRIAPAGHAKLVR